MKRPNARIQIQDTVTDRHIIPIFDVDRTDLNVQQFIPAQGFNSAPTGSVSPVVPTGATQALSGTGALSAINITSSLTTIDTTGAATSTLAVATQAGLQKTIRMIGDLGDCVITVSGTGVTSITLDDVGDFCVLISDGAGWSVVDNNGCTIS